MPAAETTQLDTYQVLDVALQGRRGSRAAETVDLPIDPDCLMCLQWGRDFEPREFLIMANHVIVPPALQWGRG